jgi:hypothetical protein
MALIAGKWPYKFGGKWPYKPAESRSRIRALRNGSAFQAAFETVFGNNIADFKPLRRILPHQC